MLFDRSRFAHGDALQATAARERFGHDAVRAQLDLPDFFENLAGNHGETVFNREPREIREQNKTKWLFPFSRIWRISRL